MKKIASLFIIFLLYTPLMIHAAGRGGGGRSIQRSPSMSRAARPTPVSKPSQISRPAPTHTPQPARISQNTPRVGGQTGTRHQVQQFVRTNPTVHSARPAQLPQNANRPGHKVVDRNRIKTAGTTVRSNFSTRYPNRSAWFTRSFWDQHNYRPSYYHHPGRWWAGATAAGIGGWLGWDNQPYYYNDYDDYGTPDTYPNYTYAPQPANEISSEDNDSDEWMPLGVFALAKDSESVASPNMFMQLALNKTGTIAGTYYNATTDETYELAGMVDPESQLAAWKIADIDDAPMMETGIYNLTQDEAPIRIYFANGTIQDMLLVHVQEF